MYLTKDLIRNNANFFSSDKLKPSLEARQEMVKRVVPFLGMQAAEKAIKEWGRPVSDITHVVLSTSSDNASPTADFRLAKLLGLRTSVRRSFVYGQYCSGSSTALRTAMDAVQNDPRARVLVVSSENLSALSFKAPTQDNLVLPAILADGAAALVIGGSATVVKGLERPLFEMVSAFDMLIPDSEAAVSSTLASSGSVISLSRSLPLYVEENIKRVMDEALSGEDRNSVFYALHPGGRAVLDKVESRLGLVPEKLRASRHVLKEYGNMSSPTVIFVLDELRRKSVEEGKATTGDGYKWGVLIGLGPGLTVETIVLRSVVLN